MKNKFFALIIFAATLNGTANAQPAEAQTAAPAQETAMPDASVKRTITGASFVSGGSSAAEKEGMRAIANDYNFKLAFMAAGAAGKPLGNMKLKVLNVKNGKAVLSGTSDGACIFSNLAPGNYRVLAERNGVKMDRTVKITTKKAPGTIFYSGSDAKKNHSGCW